MEAYRHSSDLASLVISHSEYEGSHGVASIYPQCLSYTVSVNLFSGIELLFSQKLNSQVVA
jgi:hypothetical protein